MADKVQFKVFRYDPEADKEPRLDTFEVETRRGMTVLEGLFQILEKKDGSLCFRSSCRAGVCGSCAMHINGKYRLACETQIVALKSDTVTVLPLGHLPVIRDLIVDFKPFWAKYKAIKPYIIPGDPDPERERIQTIDQREKINVMIDCILCSACHSSCTVTLTDSDYLGPAALTKACRFYLDSRDGAVAERIALTGAENGYPRCHTIFSCQEVCPKSINPTGCIAELKMAAVGQAFGIRK